jgi:hypothetical protein
MRNRARPHMLAARWVAGVARMRLQHRSRCAHRLRTPLGVCLSLALSLCAAFAQGEAIPGAQSSGVNLNKPAHFQIWRTITLGTYNGVDAYRRALESAGIKIGDAADEILGRPTFPYGTMKTDVELVLVSAADLGVETESSLADVYKRARQVGLELCPAEVGLQLRLDYRNQPRREALTIAMEPVATYSGEPTILALANFVPSGLLLIGSDGRSEFMVPSTFRFVFALPTNERLEAMREPQVVPTSSE